MHKVEAYQTSDGSVFVEQNQAIEHELFLCEKALREVWQGNDSTHQPLYKPKEAVRVCLENTALLKAILDKLLETRKLYQSLKNGGKT